MAKKNNETKTQTPEGKPARKAILPTPPNSRPRLKVETESETPPQPPPAAE